MTHAAQFALTHGAALLFTWILLQQAGVPIPSAPLLMAVGSLASNGRVRLVKESPVLPYKQELEGSRVEFHLAPFGCDHVIRKVHCRLECGFATGGSSRLICRTVSHL
jgi:hypothetical protein